jgi:signal transduction histidine kinase
VSIVLERRSDTLQIIIEHDGEGDEHDSGVLHGTHGREGTEERLTFVGGNLSIESGCGLGTTIYVRIPLVDTPTEAIG